jgi:hypothetical protein
MPEAFYRGRIMADAVLHLECPHCQKPVVVDVEARTIAPGEKAKVDMVQAVKSLKNAPQKRDEIFQKSLNAEKNKGDRLKTQFDEAMKKAKDQPAGPFVREVDLD